MKTLLKSRSRNRAWYLLAVVLTHVCEALNLFPSMQWGDDHSIGHYLDLTSAILGFTMFPVGYLLHAFRNSA